MDRNTPSFLRDLAERLRHVPGTYNIDDGDIDELIMLAKKLENKIKNRSRDVRAEGHKLGGLY